MGFFNDLRQAKRRTVNDGIHKEKSRCPHCGKTTRHYYKSEHSDKKTCSECGKVK